MSDTLAQGRGAGGVLSYISLFTSFGTLLCCALPSLLVLLGLGATVASFLSAVPWLVVLSRHKTWVFFHFRSAHRRQSDLRVRRGSGPAATGFGLPVRCAGRLRVGKPVQPDPAMGVGYNLCGWCVQRIRARASADAVRIERSTTWLPGEVRIDRLKAY